MVLNDPAAQMSSVDVLGGNATGTAAPVADLSAFATSNDIAVKVGFCVGSTLAYLFLTRQAVLVVGKLV